MSVRKDCFPKGLHMTKPMSVYLWLAQCFRRTTLRFLFCNSTLNAEQLASGLRVQDLLMGKVPCDVGVVCEFLWFIISFLMKMTILRYSILHVIDLFETVATFIRASACFADPFLPKQWPPVTGVQRVSEKPCTLYITVHGVTTSAILNKHICGLWIISTGLTILTKPDAAHENRMQSRQHFCQTSCLNSLVHFSPVTVPVHCRLWYMRKRAECKVWSVKKMEC